MRVGVSMRKNAQPHVTRVQDALQSVLEVAVRINPELAQECIKVGHRDNAS